MKRLLDLIRKKPAIPHLAAYDPVIRELDEPDHVTLPLDYREQVRYSPIVGVGDTVRKGEELARIQSNESLQSYTVVAPVSGTVLERPASVGSMATEDPIYVIADTARLVADFQVYLSDVARVQAEKAVTVSSLDGRNEAETTIERILPTVNPGNRAATARAVIDNPDARWRPGEYVRGLVTVSESQVPLAVKESGLQSKGHRGIALKT